jgi:hypothetical protein
MKTKWITGLVFAAIGLSACGPLQGENRIKAITTGRASRAGIGDSSVAPPQAALTRAQIEAVDAELMQVSVLSRNATAFVFAASTNGTKVTWMSEDGLSITLDRGLLIATRGFGPDLMGADVPPEAVSLADQTNYLRTFEFLDGLDQIERRTFQCQIVATGPETLTIFEQSYRTTRFEETCVDDAETFTNVYWRDAAGVTWQATQWVSAEMGSISYQKL